MADDVSIKFGADTSDLKSALDDVKSSLQASKSGFDGVTVSAKDFAAAMAASGNSMEKAGKLLLDQAASATKVATATKDATVSMASMPSALSSLASGANEAAKAHDHLSMSTTGAKRELIVLAHEMVQGNYSRLGGSLMVLAERMGGLSGPAMLAAAAIGGIGYAAYEIIKSITEANTALQGIENTMALMGRSTASWSVTSAQARDTLKSQVTGLSEATGIAKTDAAAVIQAIQGMATASEGTRTKLEQLTPVIAHLSGQEPVEAAKNLAKAFNSINGLDQLAHDLNLFGLEQRKAFDAAKEGDDVLKAQSITLHALSERFSEAQDYVQRFNKSQQTLSMVPKPEGTAPTGDAPDQAQVQAYEKDQKKLIADTKQTLEDIKANWTGSRAELAQLTEQTWEAVVASQRLGGSQELAAEREVERAKMELRKAAYADERSEAAAHIAQMEATGTKTRAQMLQAQISENQASLKNFQGNADERRSLETETNLLITKLHTEETAEALRGLQEVVAGTKAGSSARIAAETDVYSYIVKHYGEGSALARQYWDSIIATTNQAVAEMEAIEKRRQQTETEVDAIGVEMEKDALEAKVEAGEITTQQKIAQLQQVTDKVYESNLAQLQSDLMRFDEGSKEWEEYAGKIAVLVAQNMRDHEQSVAAMAASDKASAAASTQAWVQAAAPIERAWDGMMQGIFMGTQTIPQAMKRAGANMVLSFAESLASMTAKWVAFQAFQALGWNGLATAVKGSMDKETMNWLMGEQTKTAATMHGNAERTASDAASETTFIGRIGARIAAWLGFEEGKTAATVGGDATESTSDASATVASITASKTQAAADIPASAAQAGAGAYAATAAIPIVGPALAPAAAATAYADTLSYLGMASAAGGWGQVPFDGALTELHKDEMVLPASIATPLRAALTAVSPTVPSFSNSNTSGSSGGGSSSSSTGGTNININVTAADGASVANMFTRSASPLIRTIQNQLANGATLKSGGVRS